MALPPRSHSLWYILRGVTLDGTTLSEESLWRAPLDCTVLGCSYRRFRGCFDIDLMNIRAQALSGDTGPIRSSVLICVCRVIEASAVLVDSASAVPSPTTAVHGVPVVCRLFLPFLVNTGGPNVSLRSVCIVQASSPNVSFILP